MPTPTYIPMATVTLGSSASSVTFSSIPATFRDLVLVADMTTGTDHSLKLRFNADSGTNYSVVFMRNDFNTPESGAFSASAASITQSGSTNTTKLQANINIMDYSATDKHKTLLHRSTYDANGSVKVEAGANRYANTSAITTIQALAFSGSSFITGTRFDLYGIAS